MKRRKSLEEKKNQRGKLDLKHKLGKEEERLGVDLKYVTGVIL